MKHSTPWLAPMLLLTVATDYAVDVHVQKFAMPNAHPHSKWRGHMDGVRRAEAKQRRRRQKYKDRRHGRRGR